MYLYKRVKTKHRDFITKTKCFYYSPNGNKEKRGIRMARSSEAKQRRNDRMSYLNKKYLIYNNFDIGDMWITLTWKESQLPPDADTAHRILMQKLTAIQRKLKRENKKCVFFAKTEQGENQRVHHHLIIKNNFKVLDMIFEQWQQNGKIFDCQEIYNMSDDKLVKYFLDGGEHKNLTFEKYSHSRGMKEPEIEKRIIHQSTIKENPRPPRDTEETKHIIHNLYNGVDYQEYEVEKVKKKET